MARSDTKEYDELIRRLESGWLPDRAKGSKPEVVCTDIPGPSEPCEKNDPGPERCETGEIPVPTECYCCHGKLFWKSVYGVVVCWKCHAPGSEQLVGDILWSGEVKWHQ